MRRLESAPASPCPKNSRFGQCRDAAVVIAQRLAQHLLSMLAQHRRGDGISGRRQLEPQRRFDVGDEARGRVRDLADAMTLAYLARIEGLLNGTKITDGDV